MKKKSNELRIGIVSDIHVGFTGHLSKFYYGEGQPNVGPQEKWWEYILRYYKHRGVDVMVFPGDFTNACAYSDKNKTDAEYSYEEIIRAGEIYQKVFGGTKTKFVGIYGNHDEDCQAREIANGGDKKFWEESFGEPYTKVVHKVINGINFIGGHWGNEKECIELIKKACSENPDKPVIFMQHNPISDTTRDCECAGRRHITIGFENIKEHENLIALFGHTHAPITDELNIWQSADESKGKCTVISCGTINYTGEIGDSRVLRGDNLMSKQGLYMTINGMDIDVERISFYTDEMLDLVKGKKKKQNFKKCTSSCGTNWKFTLGKEKIYDFEYRKQRASSYEFSPTAEVGVVRSDTIAQVSFPPAIYEKKEGNFLFTYRVEAYDVKTGELVSADEVNTECHVDQTDKFFSKFYQAIIRGLLPNTSYEFRVYAKDCFGNLSKRPLKKVVETFAENQVFLK